MRQAFKLAVLPTVLSLWLTTQTLANDAITMVVSFSPGGVVDVVSRAVAAKMSVLLGSTIVVENRAGAGGNIAAQYVAKAKPDGNTLLALSGGMLTINPTLLPNTMFTHKDFSPITNFASTPNVLVVHPDLKVSSIDELIELARRKPDTLTYGTPGPGSSPHLCVELLSAERDIKLVHVPYKGAADAMRDVIANRVSLACSNILSVLPFIRDGSLRALGVTSKSRHPLLPDVPTVAESGVAGFEMLGWYGLAAPAGTPKAVVDKLNAAAVKALADPDVLGSLKNLGLTPIGDSPDSFAQYIEDEAGRWSELVRKMKIKTKE